MAGTFGVLWPEPAALGTVQLFGTSSPMESCLLVWLFVAGWRARRTLIYYDEFESVSVSVQASPCNLPYEINFIVLIQLYFSLGDGLWWFVSCLMHVSRMLSLIMGFMHKALEKNILNSPHCYEKVQLWPSTRCSEVKLQSWRLRLVCSYKFCAFHCTGDGLIAEPSNMYDTSAPPCLMQILVTGISQQIILSQRLQSLLGLAYSTVTSQFTSKWNLENIT